jgi:hypothetical protein
MADCRRVSLEVYHGGRDAERTGVLGVHRYRRSDGQVHAADTKACGRDSEGAGALQSEFNIGADRKTVDIFERYTDSKTALFHQAESFGPSSKEFFAVAKLTRWVIYGAPSDEFEKANADFHPIYMTAFDGFVR